MSLRELGEHSCYLTDTAKLSSYEWALSRLLGGKDSAVLDLGAGSGILGLIAARAGARVVFAVDSGSIIGPAAAVACRSPFSDRIVHVRGRSTEIELPETVDLAVCDQIGGFVHDAGVLEYFADARRRLLAPGGVLVPAKFRLFLAPAACETVRDQIDVWRSSPAGFDVSVFSDLAVNTEHHVDPDQVRLLSQGLQVAEIDSHHTDPITGGGTTTVTVSGRCDGLVGSFEAEMGGGATLTNHPTDPGRMQRWVNFYPIENGTQVAAGDTVELHVDVRPLLHAVTWRVTITTQAGESRVSERHSTLLGTFLAPDDLARSAGAPVAATGIGQAVARMLALADGTRSTDAILAEIRGEGLLEEGAHSVEQTLRDTLERFSKPLPSSG